MALLSLTGLLLVLAALGSIVRIARRGAPYRVGPWPGLTGAGGLLLLEHALLLAGTQLLLGPADVDLAARSAWPYVPLVAVGAVATLVLAARTTAMPGAVSAVSGAYLFPRSVVSLLFPMVAPPPILVLPAIVLDLVLWVRPSDFDAVAGLWPRRGQARQRWVWRPRTREPRTFGPRRAAAGGVAFGLLVGLLEPAQALVLGASPTAWPLSDALTATTVAALAAGAVAAVVASLTPNQSPRSSSSLRS